MTASRYASQMDVEARKKPLIQQLAAQYGGKLFLPAIGFDQAIFADNASRQEIALRVR